MDTQNIDAAVLHVALHMSELRGAIAGKRKFLRKADPGFGQKQKIQSEIGEIEEELEDLERKWPTAAQMIS